MALSLLSCACCAGVSGAGAAAGGVCCANAQTASKMGANLNMRAPLEYSRVAHEMRNRRCAVECPVDRRLRRGHESARLGERKFVGAAHSPPRRHPALAVVTLLPSARTHVRAPTDAGRRFAKI